MEEGVECELLKADSPGWQKGKIRINISLQFIPDEPEINRDCLLNTEQFLDDIRQQIEQTK